MDIGSMIQEFCMPIIVVFCYCVGFGLKKAAFFKDKYIPIAMILIGGISGLLINGMDFQNFMIGAISGASSTGVNQVYKQINKEEDSEDESI
jgi:hypothetical protein